MPVTYTDRKGRTYYLCQGVTRGGKLRYYLARQPRGEPMDEIPEGYEIGETVNAQAFVAKKRPVQIQPQEKAVVETAIGRHPKSRNYRVDVKGKRIIVYERVGPDVEDLAPMFRRIGGVSLRQVDSLRELFDQGARYTPVLRFTLSSEETRAFFAERWCYLGSIDDWIQISAAASLRQLAQRLIPRLGTDAFFEVDW